ncbi:MAG TPA: SRPBCC family protein [Verrucomicrobiae bacterium]|jgi:hypothetical protein|nr:SRPBCC family protein [Verrucomicrobiae bacterium]
MRASPDARRAHDYEFSSRWEISAPVEILYRLLEDPAGYPEWWKGVRLRVQVTEPGRPDGVGKTASFEMRGFFPYTLKWQLRCVEAVKPFRILSESTGDLEGTGLWLLEPRGRITVVRFQWNVRAVKPLLRYGSFWFRPLFIANHDRVMALCGQGLEKAAALAPNI